MGNVQYQGLLYVTQAHPLSPASHILKYGSARNVMERGQKTEEVQGSWGNADVTESNEKGSKRTVKIPELTNYHLFCKIKCFERPVSIWWARGRNPENWLSFQKRTENSCKGRAALPQAIELTLKYESDIFGQIGLVNQSQLLVKLKALWDTVILWKIMCCSIKGGCIWHFWELKANGFVSAFLKADGSLWIGTKIRICFY